ncbi:MAG: large conductance mechanosensitive channel protein MscL [bacterium]
MLEEFKKFAIKGNVIDMAVGIIIGTAFTSVINSLVKDILMPPLGLVLGKVDFSNMYINLSSGSYETLQAAQSAGVPTINYGIFINTLINFLIIASILFVVIRKINQLRLGQDPESVKTVSSTQECPYCLSQIPAKATRCPQCTSEVLSTKDPQEG